MTQLHAGRSVENVSARYSTVFAVFHKLLVNEVSELGVPGEADSVPRHGEPRADSEQDTLRILPYKVLQNRRVVDKRVQLPVQTQAKGYAIVAG